MSVSPASGVNTLLTTNAPEATAEDAEKIALRHFGLVASARALTSERDKNFHLLAQDGREFVLKIANSAEDPAVTNLQTEALRHIERQNPALPVPRACRTIEGQFEIILPSGSDSSHLVRLLTYLPGEPLYKSNPSLDQRRELGRCLAAIDRALRDFHHPGAAHELLWDIKHAAKLRAHLLKVGDTGLQSLATRFLDNFEHYALPLMPELRRQVVHNDFNPHNVLVDPMDATRIAGVLDFGDMVETPLVNDVAIAASYQVSDSDPLGHSADFVAAYHSLSPLFPQEIDILYDLIAVRQVMTIAITEWRAALYPENRAYILRNRPRAEAGLKNLARLSRAGAQVILRRACGLE